MLVALGADLEQTHLDFPVVDLEHVAVDLLGVDEARERRLRHRLRLLLLRTLVERALLAGARDRALDLGRLLRRLMTVHAVDRDHTGDAQPLGAGLGFDDQHRDIGQVLQHEAAGVEDVEAKEGLTLTVVRDDEAKGAEPLDVLEGAGEGGGRGGVGHDDLLIG